MLQGDDKLSMDQIGEMLDSFDATVANITERHPEPLEQRVLLFWEFFEVLMQCCRELVVTVGTPLHEGIPAFVTTAIAVMNLVDRGEIALPVPSADDGDIGEMMEEEE